MTQIVIAYEIELQVSHSICTKVQETSILWGETAGNRGYYVDTVGKNAKKIEEYVRHQQEEDKAGEQLTMGNF